MLTNSVVVDDVLCFSLCGHDSVWAGSACREKASSVGVLADHPEGYDGRVKSLTRC